MFKLFSNEHTKYFFTILGIFISIFSVLFLSILEGPDAGAGAFAMERASILLLAVFMLADRDLPNESKISHEKLEIEQICFYSWIVYWVFVYLIFFDGDKGLFFNGISWSWISFSIICVGAIGGSFGIDILMRHYLKNDDAKNTRRQANWPL